MWLLFVLLFLLTTRAWAGQLDATWTAPTTNTDGSPVAGPLTYRVYWQLFPQTPCPGSQFIVTTPNALAATLLGLTQGMTYSAQVTAVNANGVESACSMIASAPAHADPPPPPLAAGSHLQLVFVSPPPPPSSVTITGITPTSYARGTLTAGATIYVDRTYTATTVPARVQGAAFIRTANNDKAGTSPTAVRFTIDRPASILVAYVAGVTRPAWLSQWTDTGLTLGTTDVPMRLYEQAAAAGVVTLGGNQGAESMYLVIVTP